MKCPHCEYQYKHYWVQDELQMGEGDKGDFYQMPASAKRKYPTRIPIVVKQCMLALPVVSCSLICEKQGSRNLTSRIISAKMNFEFIEKGSKYEECARVV